MGRSEVIGTRGESIISVLEILTGIGILVFWTLFFTIGLAPERPPACYFAFEESFPLPDALLALGLLVGGTLLLKGRSPAKPISVACGGGLIFLGLLDFSFNIRNGMYALTPIDATYPIFINAWCVGFGLAVIIKLGKGSMIR